MLNLYGVKGTSLWNFYLLLVVENRLRAMCEIICDDSGLDGVSFSDIYDIYIQSQMCRY